MEPGGIVKTVEERLRSAAEETRRYAAGHRPPDTREEKAPTRTANLLVFVAAFAVVVALFTLPGLLTRIQPGEQPTVTEPLGAPGSVPGTTLGSGPTTTVGASECSSSGTPPPAEDPALPDPVADTRLAVVEAAAACDLDVLVDLAGPGFVTSFGGGGAENFRLWEESGEGRLDVLLLILGMSHGVVPDGQGGEIYVWPAAFAHDSWDDISAEEMEGLNAIYTEEQLDEIGRLGFYGGWRTGIDEEGDWLFFVAGD